MALEIVSTGIEAGIQLMHQSVDPLQEFPGLLLEPLHHHCLDFDLKPKHFQHNFS
jgi:hypothetical protein